MKSKHPLYSLIILFSVFAAYCYANDYTQVGLPDGAIARLGKGGINIMRFSPDGSKLAVGTDVCVWLYDVSDGNATALFTDKPIQVNALAFSNDGSILASGGFGNTTIQLWNLESDTKHSTLFSKSVSKSVYTLGFIGKTLLSFDSSGRITYWNIGNGDILTELKKVNPNKAAAFSPTTKYVAVADTINKIHIYDTSLSNKHLVLQDDGFKGGIISLAITSNNKILVSGGDDEFIRIWDIEERKQIKSLNVQDAKITSIAISPNDKIIASGDASKEIILWNVENPNKLRTILGHKNTITAITFSPDGAGKYSGCLASGSLDGTIRFWNPDTGEELITFTTGHTKWIKDIAFSENGSTLVSSDMTGNVGVWNLSTYQEVATFSNGESDYANSVAFTTDAKYFVCQGLNGWQFTFQPYGFGYTSKPGESFEAFPLRMWDITTGEQVSGPWNENSCNILTISPDNKILAIYESDSVLGWNIDSATEVFNISTEDIWFIDNILMSPDNKFLAMYESSEKPSIWNLEKPEDPPIQTKSRINSLAFSPDGNSIAILSSGSIFIHDLEMLPDDEPEEINADLYGNITRILYSPDSKILVCTGLSGDIFRIRIKLLDVETGQEIMSLAGHTEFIDTLTFSHDGKFLASGSFDGTILLWDWEEISKRQENFE